MTTEATPAPAVGVSTGGPGFLLITGLSGAGRSEAAHSLEDLALKEVDEREYK